MIRFTGPASGFTVIPADLSILEEIGLTLSGSSVAEGSANAGAVSVTASFTGATASDLTAATEVALSFGAGEGAEAADFGAPGAAITLSIPAGMTSGSATALSGLTITGDTIAEGDEKIDISGAAAGFWVDGPELTIVDDDLGVALTADTDSGMNGEQKSLAEGETAAVRVRAAFTTATFSDLGSALDIDVTAGESSPQSARGGGVDFTAPSSPVAVSIPTGSALQSSWVNLAGLSVVDDSVTELAETFEVTGSVTGMSGVTVASDTLTIGASDTGLEVTASPGTAEESSSAHTVTVTAELEGSSSELVSDTDVTVTAAAGDTDGATVASSVCPTATEDVCTDKPGNSFTVSIPAGAVSGSGSFQLTARDDSATETPEKVKISGSATVAGVSESDTFDVNVVDSAVTLALADGSTPVSALAEDSGTTTVTVTATLPVAAPAGAVIGLNLAGTATADADGVFTEREDYRVTLPAKPAGTPDGYAAGIDVGGSTTGTADIMIRVNDDSVDEPAKTIVFIGGNVSINSVDYHTVAASLTLNDGDAPPNTIGISLFDDADGEELTRVDEGGSDTVVRVRAAFDGSITRSAATSVPVVVGKLAGEAAEGTDYETVPDFNVTIPAYESSGTGTFTLKTGGTYDDSAFEGPERVTVAGGTLAGVTIGGDDLTIIDDDLTVALSVSPDEATEGPSTGGAVTIRAAYPGSETLAASQTVALSFGGTAAATDDYTTAAAPGSVTIPANTNSGTQTLTFSSIVDDDIAEGDETLRISGTLAGFAVSPAVFTIKDNDDPPTGITLSVTPSSLGEGTSNRRVTVTARLNGSKTLPDATPVTVSIPGSGSTARSGSDYRITNRLTSLTIPAGSSTGTGTFTISINTDTAGEPAERINITGGAAGFTVAPAVLTIPANSAPAPPAPPPSGGGGAGGGGGGGGGAPPPAQPSAQPQPPACVGRFCDDDGSVHEANIERIAQWQITLGCSATDPTLFCPSADITRRQMAAFLYRAVSQRWTIQAPARAELSDVGADVWYRTYADWVISVNAFAAPGGVFNPGGVVTRADMAIMMIAAFPHLEAVDEPEGLFRDAQGADPSVIRAIEGMYQTRVTRGCSTSPLNYCPDQPVTRAQMASFFVRAIDQAPPATPQTAGSGS